MINTPVVSRDPFSFRGGEALHLVFNEPGQGLYIAVMARSLDFPTDEYVEETVDGERIQKLAIVAAKRRHPHALWRWIHLAPDTKKIIGDMILNNGRPDRWYYLQIKALDYNEE